MCDCGGTACSYHHFRWTVIDRQATFIVALIFRGFYSNTPLYHFFMDGHLAFYFTKSWELQKLLLELSQHEAPHLVTREEKPIYFTSCWILPQMCFQQLQCNYRLQSMTKAARWPWDGFWTVLHILYHCTQYFLMKLKLIPETPHPHTILPGELLHNVSPVAWWQVDTEKATSHFHFYWSLFHILCSPKCHHPYSACSVTLAHPLAIPEVLVFCQGPGHWEPQCVSLTLTATLVTTLNK